MRWRPEFKKNLHLATVQCLHRRAENEPAHQAGPRAPQEREVRQRARRAPVHAQRTVSRHCQKGKNDAGEQKKNIKPPCQPCLQMEAICWEKGFWGRSGPNILAHLVSCGYEFQHTLREMPRWATTVHSRAQTISSHATSCIRVYITLA